MIPADRGLRAAIRRLAARLGAPRRGPAAGLPYPVAVRRRDVAAEPVPDGGGLETFDAPPALAINAARLEHLAALGLPLEGRRVLDVGCGVGHLAQFFVAKGCDVVCVDGRAENVAALRQRHPGLTAHVLDVEREPLARLGRFPVVFSYGLLYHLENPLAGLRNMAGACEELLLLETLVCDAARPLLVVVDEPKNANQALGGVGCRPSPSFVVWALSRAGFPFVYAPVRPPEHPDFRFAWRDSLDDWRDGHPLRCVFVASRHPMQNPALQDLVAGE